MIFKTYQITNYSVKLMGHLFKIMDLLINSDDLRLVSKKDVPHPKIDLEVNKSKYNKHQF